ncbi:MAG: cytochrome [Aeromicrobium sp.]|jgi:cytochrome P450|uniref:cytochrome P450 n=1 Tax=Aeromicrobium sp. TaxID=1871063 RepID=UPI00263202C1|nr:cytochrome P450 [Aeromicrobium sp.]MCW2788015.1 cytochrome [Aeromicrobium sp.]MCW2825767.1 cytochrome [Aeromicrobium sp.]
MALDASTTIGTTPPRKRGLPYIGSTLAYIRDPLRMMRRHYDGYGPVSDIDFIGKRWTVLLGPDACEAALRNADKAFASGDGWGYLVGPFFDRGLMLLDFEEHHRHRRIMQAAFTRDRLEGYTAALQPAVERGLDEWQPRNGFEAYPALKELTLDLAMKIFMGGEDLASREEMDRLNHAFIDCVQSATSLIRADVPGTRWGRALRGRAVLEEFLRRHLATKRAAEGDDLFSVLCHITTEDGERFSDDDIVNHMIFLLMAAHDTSTITVSTIMRFLGQHPEWQERCREESMGLPADPTMSQLEGLTSLDLVMKESLRLVPPVPVLARKTVKETVVMGRTIPADRLVAVMVHLSHHMDELWDDPERFDPSRFAEDRREDKVHRYAWEPFGGGVHKCLGIFFAGAEVKTIVHHLLRRFEWTVDPDYTTPMSYTSLPYPKDGQPIDLRPLSPGRTTA